MSNVTLELGGRSYAVACADGQEAHVLRLGRTIDAKLATMPNAGAQSEARMLLFAALLMADECHELKLGTKPGGDGDALGEALEKLAGRLESFASTLEGGAAST
jgi:cell division protein ZapA